MICSKATKGGLSKLFICEFSSKDFKVGHARNQLMKAHKEEFGGVSHQIFLFVIYSFSRAFLMGFLAFFAYMHFFRRRKTKQKKSNQDEHLSSIDAHFEVEY